MSTRPIILKYITSYFGPTYDAFSVCGHEHWKQHEGPVKISFEENSKVSAQKFYDRKRGGGGGEES